MGEWLRRFMMGRYGNDQLNRALLVGSAVCLVIGWIANWGILVWISLIGLVAMDIRFFSKNIGQRQQENAKFLRATAKLRSEAEFQKRKWQDRNTHVYFKCPQCQARLRVPKGKGKVVVRCNRCGHEFEKVS